MLENQNWKNSFQQAFKNSQDLFHYLGWNRPGSELVEKNYPLFIPKRLAHKIKMQGPDGVLAKEFLPDRREIDEVINFDGLLDPIGDKEHYKAPQLIHRYTTRALFTPTSICPVLCRYCFRKNELNSDDEIFQADFQQTLNYLSSHPEISEIIFTGGDPLTLSNDKLSRFLEAFSTIDSIKDIRFHTRYPVILPERLDEGFSQLMNSFAPKFRTMSLAIHANHAEEFDAESVERIQHLSKLTIQLLSQTVLLKGINNSIDTLLSLFNLFISMKVRPYYLHHPDQVKGGLHFYLPLSEGRSLYSKLRDQLPGWAVPHYVIDIPGGAGKVSAFNPETMKFSGNFIGRNGLQIPVKEPDSFNP
jgi:lysine 2,3-aminomutase